MKKVLITLATLISGVAIVLALDPGHFAFRYIDVGGHQLEMLITGQGSPAVVFEAGGSGANGAPLEMWERVQPGVSRFATTVSYDRAGIGLSGPGPSPRDARQIARELHTALQNAGVAPPYILVGHSLGGPFIRVFADLYPREVGGLVLVDPTQEEFIFWNQAHDTSYVARQDAEGKDIQASLTEAQASRVPAGVPVVLITGMGPRVLPSFATEKQKREYRANHKLWLKYHTEWLKKVPNGQHIVTENSGHDVPFQEPELIIRVIRQMVEQARNGP